MAMQPQSDTIVRRSVRHDVVMRARFSVHADYARGVVMNMNSGAREGWLDVDVVDFGAGGLGFMSPLFVPRRVLINLRVYGPGESGEMLLETAARVQRVMMTDRRPAYLVGVAFERVSAFVGGQIDILLERCAGGVSGEVGEVGG